MKKHVIIFSVALVALLAGACSQISSNCECITKKELVILMDVTDTVIFNASLNDLNENFSGFMDNQGLGQIKECSSFKLSIAPIVGGDVYELSSETVSVNRKGLSKQQFKKLTDPTKQMKMLKSKLDYFKQLSQTPEATLASPVANTIIKAINNVESDSDATILVFTDLMEHYGGFSFYRSKNDMNADFSVVVETVIDPLVLNEFNKNTHKKVRVIFVVKQSGTNVANRRDLKQFWAGLMQQLEIQAVFVDNLTNI